MNRQRPADRNLKGWLKRKGGRIHKATWSRKWFVLTDKFLFIFGREDDAKSQDCITLDNHVIVEPPVDLNDPKRVYFDILTDPDKGISETVISLSAETEDDKKMWVRALKRALYADKGGALFSQSLEEIMVLENQNGRRIPYILEECVNYLYKHGLDVEGIFRLPGRQSSIKDIISRFERGKSVNLEEEGADVHAVASVLKAFLRDLPDSIIPCDLFQKFMNFALRFQEASNDSDKSTVVEELGNAMTMIPEDNYVILKYICTFLKDVAEHETSNKMDKMNLGTIFGYNIIRHIDKENSQLFLCTADLGQNLVYMLLAYFKQVFSLEYSMSAAATQVNNSVPVADLLRMSTAINVPAAIPDSSVATSPGHLADLEGIDMFLSSGNSKDDPRLTKRPSLRITIEEGTSSSVRMRNAPSLTGSDSGTSTEENSLVSSTEVMADSAPPRKPERTYRPGSCHSLPATPTTEIPVAPQRSRSKKLTRYRGVSEKRRPGGIVVVSGEGDQDNQSSNTLPSGARSPAGVKSEDVIAALERANICHNTNGEDTAASRLSKSGYNDTLDVSDRPVPLARKRNVRVHRSPSSSSASITVTSSDQGESQGTNHVGKSSTMTSEARVKSLQDQNDLLNDQLAKQKQHHRQQVHALQTQITHLRNHYEQRVQDLESQLTSQRQKLQARVTQEEAARTAAVNHTIRLKEELHRYQMQYGELPS